MAHPCAGQAKTGQQIAKARYADGGGVPESTRQEGLARLKTKFGQEDAPKWIDAEGKDAQITAGLVRRTSDNPYTQGK